MRTVETKKIMFAVLAAALVATLVSVSYIESVSAVPPADRGCARNIPPTCGTVGADPDTNEAIEAEKEAADEAAEANEPDKGECC